MPKIWKLIERGKDMQNNEVIQRIKYIKDTFGVAFSDLDHEALDLGIKAIEKQTPLRWIDTKSYLNCPKCNSFYDMVVPEKYCSNCGQRLISD